MIPASTLTAQQQTITVTKCQDCSNKASKTLQACMAGSGAAGAQACQKSYQGKMNHCNKKWCNPKTKKIKVNTRA
jgi:hypothetical protein